MKYSFETSEQIIDCLDCPFYDPQLDEKNRMLPHIDYICNNLNKIRNNNK